MTINELLQLATPDDLPPPFNDYAKIIGIENVIALSEISYGKKIYIRNLDSLLMGTRRRLIRAEHENGATLEALAEKYDVCTKTVCTYIRK